MSDLHVLAEIPKGRDRLRVALDVYGGRRIVDIRVCAKLSETSDIWTPTRKGVAFAIEKLPDIAQAVASAERLARELGWLTDAVAA